MNFLVDNVVTGTEFLIVVYFVGNASHEPGTTHDAHARPATLYAPSRHDTSSGYGTWSDASWCHRSWSDDAGTDAWTNASAGRAWPTFWLSMFLSLGVLLWHLSAFIFPGCRKSSKSHPLPDQPARGDKRTYAVHALQPVSNSSFSVFSYSYFCVC